MNIWTCLTCFNDYTGPTLHCEVCFEPLCTTCKHRHTESEIRSARLIKLDFWLQDLHVHHPVKFYLLTLGVFALIVAPLLLVMLLR